eukprot:Ihof_evm9s13 gene=Ihof_evmTU9s13
MPSRKRLHDAMRQIELATFLIEKKSKKYSLPATRIGSSVDSVSSFSCSVSHPSWGLHTTKMSNNKVDVPGPQIQAIPLKSEEEDKKRLQARRFWRVLAKAVKAGSLFTKYGYIAARNPELWYPLTKQYVAWHLTMACATYYYTFAVPIRFCFGWGYTSHWLFAAIDIVCDIILAMNVYFEQHAVYVEHGIPYDNINSIRKNYFENSYTFDLVTVIPWDIGLALAFLIYRINPIELWRSYPYMALGGDLGGDSLLLPFMVLPFRLLRTIIVIILGVVWYRGLKMLRLWRINSYINSIAKYTSKINTVECVKLILNVILVGHFIGCGYYLIVATEGFSGNSWLPDESFKDLSVSRQVLVSFYWGFSSLSGTLSTARSPITLLETFYSFLIGCISISLFSHTIGNVGKIMKSVNGISQNYRSQVERINRYMAYRQIPQHLQRRVRQYFEYLHSRQNGYEDEVILQDFPGHLKLEIYRHLCRDIVKKVPLFKHSNQAFIDKMVVLLKPRIYSPGDYIIRVDEAGDEMFFISEGKVQVEDRHQHIICDLGEGDFFGEIALTSKSALRTASVVAVTFCDIFVFAKRDLDAILEEFPEDAHLIELIARQRLRSLQQ